MQNHADRFLVLKALKKNDYSGNEINGNDNPLHNDGCYVRSNSAQVPSLPT
jgi:hypothetical protein